MDNIYAKGIYFNKLHPDTPAEVKKWKKGGIAIHIDNAIEHLNSLRDKADEKGYIKYDLTLNEGTADKESFYSFKLNTWKADKDKISKKFDEIAGEDSPF